MSIFFRWMRFCLVAGFFVSIAGSNLLAAQSGQNVTPYNPPDPPAGLLHADLLRGEYGPYRANNDLLFYHLDMRVDPEKKYHQRQEHHPLQDAAGRNAHPARSARGAEHRQDSAGR